GLRLGLGDDRGAGSARLAFALTVIVGHAGRSVAAGDGGRPVRGEVLSNSRVHDIAEARSIPEPWHPGPHTRSLAAIIKTGSQPGQAEICPAAAQLRPN